MRTLGYSSDKFITVALNNCEKGEMAGGKGNYNHQKSHGISEADLKFIEEHVKEKYQPGISHYRRSHAPHRLYVDSSLTVKDIYDSYKTACISETPPKVAVSKSTFAKQLNFYRRSYVEFGGITRNYAGFGRIWRDYAGFGGITRDLAGLRGIWRDYAGFGGISGIGGVRCCTPPLKAVLLNFNLLLLLYRVRQHNN